ESHAHDHTDLTKIGPVELKQQLAESRRILCESGLGRGNILAVPGGYHNDAVIKTARDCGFTAVRTIRWGCNRIWNPERVESYIINRKTAGRWFAPLISPRFDLAKRSAYQAKEALKDRLPLLYRRWRG